MDPVLVMGDPRLNSVHLDDVRREEFRRAREALLNARGTQTLMGESKQDRDWAPANPHTLVQNLQNVKNLDAKVPPDLKCWLMDKEFIYPLRIGLNTIGRSPDNDVVIPDSFVSRRHCAIVVHASNGFEIHDVASKNGTFLNGRKLAGPTTITSGDEIRMCDRQFIFVTKTGGDPNPPNQMPTQTE